MRIRKVPHSVILAAVSISVLVIAVGNGAVLSNEKQLALEEIRDGIRIRRAHLDGYSATLFIREYHGEHDGVRQFPPIPTALRWEVKRSGHKVRVVREMRQKQSYAFAWNGTKVTTLLTDDNLPVAQRFSGTILSKPPQGTFQAYQFLTPLEERIFDFDRPLSDLVNAGRWTLVGSEVIAGHAAWHIRGTELLNLKRATLDVWLDASRDFAPVCLLVSMTIRQKLMQEGLDDVQLAQVDGMWHTRHARGWVRNPETLPRFKQMYEYDIDNVRVGQSFDDEQFIIQFPPGTMVWDDIVKVGFKAGELPGLRVF